MQPESNCMGFGLGLRAELYESVLNDRPDVDWFGIRAEAFLSQDAELRTQLQSICQHYPVTLHTTSLNIGCDKAPNDETLKRLEQLAQIIQPVWVSDHLCTRNCDGYGLQPLEHTPETLKLVVARIKDVQDRLDRRLLFENIPSPTPNKGAMPDWEFVAEVAEKSDSYILIDINSLYASSLRQSFNTSDYLAALPVQRVKQIYLAPKPHKEDYGLMEEKGTAHISDPILLLYQDCVRMLGLKDTLIERNDAIPTLEEMLMEREQVKAAARYALRNPAL